MCQGVGRVDEKAVQGSQEVRGLSQLSSEIGNQNGVRPDQLYSCARKGGTEETGRGLQLGCLSGFNMSLTNVSLQIFNL